MDGWVKIDGLVLFKTPVAARYVGVTAQHLRRLAMSGHEPQPVRREGRGAGGGNFYKLEDLDAYIAERAARQAAREQQQAQQHALAA